MAILALVYVRPTVTAAAVGYGVQFVTKFAVGWWLFRKYPSGEVRWNVFLRYWHFALPNALASIVGFIYLHVDRLLLKWLASAEAVGYLYGAQKYVQLLLMVSAATLSLVMTQASTYHSRGDLDALRRLTHRSQKYLSLVIAPLIAGTATFATPIVHVLLGGDYTASVPLLQVLCIQVFGMSISRPLGMVLYGIDRPGLGSTLSVLTLGVGVGLTFVLVPSKIGSLPGAGLGAMGVAVSLAARSLFSWIALSVVLRMLADVEFYLKPVAHVLCAVSIAAGVQYIVPNWAPLLQLVAGGSLLLVLYVAVLNIVGEIAEREWSLARRLVLRAVPVRFARRMRNDAPPQE
jgi:O-antigen/teichoic acid export membrane protein